MKWTVRSRGRTCCSWVVSLGLALVIVAILAATAAPAQAQVFKTLYSFPIVGSTGYTPEAGLVQDASGNLYSTTTFGGLGYGVVFKLDPQSHVVTVLYSFTGGTDGSFPEGAIAQDAEGNLYGTTSSGGDVCGCGVVFKVDPLGNETVLHSFTGGAADGVDPNGVVRDAAGNLYGTTFGGGDSGNGVVFKVDAGGAETLLYNFKGLGDGGTPYGGLILDAGNLYGTTAFGGLFGGNRCGNGCGVVFKLDRAGDETVLYPFDGNTGKEPHGSLVRDAAGNLYGTTLRGGNTDLGPCLFAGCGVVFKVAPGGHETLLHNFTGGADGANPYAGLARDAAGNFYGTTSMGGSGGGVVFELNPNGQETILHSFANEGYSSKGERK